MNEKVWHQFRRVDTKTGEEEIRPLDTAFTAEMALIFIQGLVKPHLGYVYYFAREDAVEVPNG